MQTLFRFALVAGLLWAWISVSQAEGSSPLVTLLPSGKAQAAGHAPEMVKKAVAAGNKIVGKPYKWGGGHGVYEDTGYDCSGAASFLLREMGVMKGVRASKGFLTFGEAGEGEHLTIWVRTGHVFITVAGLRFDTHGEDAADGPHWTEEKRAKDKFQPRRLQRSSR
ncbi:hypothetical protein [Roseibacillus ishigakijimensis]|uniref:NlpC/P60 family protein n=1 Tax=Roseibacillus ishigakijimensis TaxID=454146 RepID=A0A934RTZ8_9BACT|nr:hypothetical protein [Roseibacillus ishigakijimensis]MBK1834135.1 hypothetical protein [Roseibacillus ishigakijimensis]